MTATARKSSQRSGAVLCLAVILAAPPALAASLISVPFGTTTDGKPVTRHIMATSAGVSVSFMNYGGAITNLLTPDRHGHRAPIVLGFATLRDYETKGAQGEFYFGALLGRYANWIARGRFSLDGHEYQLALSDPPNTIHGGNRGFDKRVWTVQPQTTSGQSVGARLTYTSPDGEEGYPGTLQVSVTYTLSEDGAFAIHYEAVTDKDTVVNLSNHMNFNLAGAGSPGGVLEQILTVDADQYLPLDRSQIPLGRLASVNGTPFDFREPTAIGARIHDKNEQLAIAGGYDQYWVLDKHGGPRATAVGRARLRSQIRAHAGVSDHRARRADLHRRLVRRVLHRYRWPLRPIRRLYTGDATLPRQSEQPGLPDDRAQAGADLQQHDDLPLRCAEIVPLVAAATRVRSGLAGALGK